MQKGSLHRFAVIIIFIYITASATQASNGEKEKREIQKNVRKNMPDEVKKENKKEKQAVKENSLSREDRIRAMGPNALTMIKRNTEMKIKQFQTKINKTKQMTDKEKDFKVHLLTMFIEELTESERDMIEAQEALRKSLLTDFRGPGVLRENSKKRLESLRIATLKEEQSYNRIINLEEALKTYVEHGNDTMSLMDEFLKDIANAADQLEIDIEQKILPDDNAMVDGAHIEAVVHMKEGEENIQQAGNTAAEIGKPNEYDERLDMLVDSQNNKYILTRPKDTTSPSIDHYLVLDIIFIFIVSFPLGLICNSVGVPSMFGYIMAGLLLGPSGLNVIQAIVQVETFGEFGVFLIMFFAGIEFSVEKIQKVWKVAVQASLLISICMTLCGLFIGTLLNFNIPKGESAFVAACMSMSSTPLVVRFLQGTSTHESVDYAALLLGMLVMQDVQLGIIVATLPAFAPMINSNFGNALMYTTVMMLRTIGSLGIILLLVSLLTKYFIPKYLIYIGKQSKEIIFLGSLTLMFAFQLSTNYIGISMELGCFLAGLVISICNFQQVVERAVLPLHDFFATLFFATVGFHVFPKFVAVELTYLIFLTAVVIGGKYILSFMILHWILPKNKQHVKWLVSGGLAQVSEFSFVLASRARHLKIVTREVFLLILSITTLSFVFAPVIWKLSLWKFKRTSYTS